MRPHYGRRYGDARQDFHQQPTGVASDNMMMVIVSVMFFVLASGIFVGAAFLDRECRQAVWGAR